MNTDLTWLIGGPQGSGVESGANIFSKVCAGIGYQVFGKREFYSNIKGEHSYFAVRISDKKIHSNVNDVHLMVAFDGETIFRHADEVVEGGAIIYDSDLEDTKIDEVHTLDIYFKSRLEKYLESKNKEFSIKGILETAKERGVILLPVSFREILSKLAENTNNPKLKGMIRMFNVIGVSLSIGILGLDSKPLLDSIESIFSKKPMVAEINKQVANYAYNYATAKFDKINFSPNSVSKEPNTILVQGHQGTAIGKMIGSALTGTRSSTCTSGPGFSLMAESLGWAGMNEVPVVITNYQRSGPSTGLPTRHGQDDLLFTINAGHGEFPRIVYASGAIEESFYDTGKCFNFADIFQVPVIHLLDKFIASSVITCKRFDPEKVTIDRGKLLDKIKQKPYKRFEQTSDGISPRSKLGLEDGIFWNTGDESDEYGHISEDPYMRIQMMDKRLSRFDLILNQIPKEDQVVSFGMADHCIISWGSTKGPIIDAIDMLKKENITVGFIQLKLLHPFPTEYVKSLLKDVKTIIDVEANHTGQLGILFKQNLGRDVDYFILKYTGRSMTSTEIYDSLKKILGNKAKKREILTHGA